MTQQKTGSCFLFVALAWLSPVLSLAQINREYKSAEPVGGVETLSLYYFKIDFTKGQRQVLADVPIELIFMVDSVGVATLEKVNGISDPDILDSLRAKKDIPLFKPLTRDGKRHGSVYFMQLTFPRYSPYNFTTTFDSQLFGTFSPDEVDYVKSGVSSDLVVGGITNIFQGNIHEYLASGLGAGLCITISGKKSVGYGLMANFYGNHLKKNFPINTTRAFEHTPTSYLLGFVVSKKIKVDEKSALTFQGEICFAGVNLSKRTSKNDTDYIELNGYSPGIVANYSVQLGKERFFNQPASAGLHSNHINIHLAIRPLFFDLHASRGVMVEIGVGYRAVRQFAKYYSIRH
jgi:hypothetical protein